MFMSLFNYITGKNETSAKIPMTVPVSMLNKKIGKKKMKKFFHFDDFFRIVLVILPCISDVITGIAYRPGDNAMVSMIVMTNLMNPVVHLVSAMKNSDARKVASVC